MNTTCVRCGRPMADQAYADQECARRVERALLGDDRNPDRPGLVDTAPAARDIAQGQNSRTSGGGGTGKPGSRLPLDLAATAKLDAVQGMITTWARHVAEERHGRSLAHAGEDPIVHAARYLAANLEWLRHRPEADEAFGAIEACARIVAGIARGPAGKKYLGPCGTLIDPNDCSRYGIGDHDCAEHEPCDGNVYARIYTDGTVARIGACRTCHTEFETDQRTAWLDDEVRQRAYRVAQISDAYGISENTIRTWAHRVRPDTGEPILASYWRTPAGLITPWVDPVLDDTLTGAALKARLGEISDEIKARGGRLHYVGDVLDLAAADAARREERRAERQRRTAARAAEEASNAA